MDADARLDTGRLGEAAVVRLYRELGFRVVERNWRCRLGEIDLILERRWTLVFVEVKTRRSARFGGGFHAVDPRKQQKLRAVAEAFILRTGAQPCGVRFDVASVWMSPDGMARIELFVDAF